jgi:hypothetical protein
LGLRVFSGLDEFLRMKALLPELEEATKNKKEGEK